MRYRNLEMLGVAALAAAVMMTAHAEPVVGEAAPGFSLPDLNGKTHQLSDYTGKVVVLEWINYDCPFVKKFYSKDAMQAWQRKYAEKDVVWLSICSSAPGKQGHYALDVWPQKVEDRNAAPAAVLLDTDGTVGRLYQAKTTPHMFVINADGILEYMGAIDDQPSAKADPVEGARNYVVEALTAVLAGSSPDVTETAPYGCSVKY